MSDDGTLGDGRGGKVAGLADLQLIALQLQACLAEADPAHIGDIAAREEMQPAAGVLEEIARRLAKSTLWIRLPASKAYQERLARFRGSALQRRSMTMPRSLPVRTYTLAHSRAGIDGSVSDQSTPSSFQSSSSGDQYSCPGTGTGDGGQLLSSTTSLVPLHTYGQSQSSDSSTEVRRGRA